MHNLSFSQYLKLNKSTIKYALRVTILIFSVIATLLAVIFVSEKEEMTSFEIFLLTELYGNGLGIVIISIAIWEGYAKAKMMIRRYNKIPRRVRESYKLELRRTDHNPKHWFLKLEIVANRNGQLITLDLHQLRDFQRGKPRF